MTKVRVRYVGSAPAEIMDTPYRFTVYGQPVEMPEALYKAARSNRVHLLTEEEFQSLGHTSEEIKQFGRLETHSRASVEFQTKLRQAWALCQGVEPVQQTTIEEVNDNA